MIPNAEIDRLLVLLEQGRDDYEKLAVVAAEAEVAYRIAHGKALLSADATSDPKRKAQADIATERQCLDYKVAGALRDAARERQSSIRTALEACRTLSANERAIVG